MSSAEYCSLCVCVAWSHTDVLYQHCLVASTHDVLLARSKGNGIAWNTSGHVLWDKLVYWMIVMMMMMMMIMMISSTSLTPPSLPAEFSVDVTEDHYIPEWCR